MKLKKLYFPTIIYLCLFFITIAVGHLKQTIINCGTSSTFLSYCIDCANFEICVSQTYQSCTSGQACKQYKTYANCEATSTVSGCTCPPTGIVYLPDAYDNQKYITCVNGVRVDIELCPSNTFVNPETGECSLSSPAVRCQYNTFSIIQVSCTSYKYCFTNNTESFVIVCNSGQMFNPNTNLCEPYKTFTCEGEATNQYYADPHDCNKYYLCISEEQAGGPFYCPPGEVWDVGNQRCTTSSTACVIQEDCGVCKDDITVFAIDCNRYYQCTASTTGDLDYVPVEKACPTGFYFDPVNNFCTTTPPTGC